MITRQKGGLCVLALISFSFFSPLIAHKKRVTPVIDLCAYIPPQDMHVKRDDAVTYAFQHRKDLEAFIFAEEASRYDERVALAGYLPQIQLAADIGKAGPDLTTTVTGGNPLFGESLGNRDISISISQLIINGGGPVIDYKITQEATKIVQENMKLTQDNIRLAVETAFLTMQRLILQKTFIESQDIASRSLFEQSSAKNVVGFLNESTWLSATASYMGNQTAIANYMRNVQTALWTLQRQTNSAIKTDEISLSLEDAAKFELRPLEVYIEKAYQNRPNLKVQDHMIRQAQLSEKKYALSYVPSISLLGEAAEEMTRNNNVTSWFIGVGFTWNLDGLAGVHSARKSEKQEIEYVLQKKDMEFQVKLDVETAYNSVKNNIMLLKTAVAQFEQADATLQLKKKQFDVGTISRIDFDQAQMTYESTKFQLDSTKIDTRLAYQNLLFACGYPQIDTLRI
jgi:outer membrane protein